MTAKLEDFLNEQELREHLTVDPKDAFEYSLQKLIVEAGVWTFKLDPKSVAIFTSKENGSQHHSFWLTENYASFFKAINTIEEVRTMQVGRIPIINLLGEVAEKAKEANIGVRFYSLDKRIDYKIFEDFAKLLRERYQQFQSDN